MEIITAIWPDKAYKKFKDFIYNLKIDENIKNTIMGEAYNLVSETAFLQIRDKIRNDYLEKQY